MPLLKLSCVNCSAPLEISNDLERFACSYCGTAQVVERSGGVVSLRRVEAAIGAVQRGTDRTAAELAIPRLKEELAHAQRAKAEAVKKAKALYNRGGSGRLTLAIISFFILFFVGLGMMNKVWPEDGTVTTFAQIFTIAFLISLVAVPIFIFFKVKRPSDTSPAVEAEHNELIADIERMITKNRAFLAD